LNCVATSLSLFSLIEGKSANKSKSSSAVVDDESWGRGSSDFYSTFSGNEVSALLASDD